MEAKMRATLRFLIGSTLFALALIASSWLLRGNPIGDWVDAGIYLAYIVFFTAHLTINHPHIFAPKTDC
jgi:hypothetical protein